LSAAQSQPHSRDGGYDCGYYGYNPSYSTSYYTPNDQTAAYCAQRFKSYDPGSGTYLGYDGQRHP
jgi:hypothetical protein